MLNRDLIKTITHDNIIIGSSESDKRVEIKHGFRSHVQNANIPANLPPGAYHPIYRPGHGGWRILLVWNPLGFGFILKKEKKNEEKLQRRKNQRNKIPEKLISIVFKVILAGLILRKFPEKKE